MKNISARMMTASCAQIGHYRY